MDDNTFDLSDEVEESYKGPVFTAMYDAICNECDDGIEPGDPVRYDADGDLAHEGCA